MRLDWAGFFAFSREDGTAAANMSGVVADSLVRERLRECSEVQEPITAAARAALVGREIDVLVDGVDDDDVMRRAHPSRSAGDRRRRSRLIGSSDMFARPGAIVRATVCGVEGPDLDAKVRRDRSRRAAAEPRDETVRSERARHAGELPDVEPHRDRDPHAGADP